MHPADYELEKSSGPDESAKVSISMSIPPETQTIDIEHVPVQDDPRNWSPLRKVRYYLTSVPLLATMFNLPSQNVTLALIAFATMIAGLSSNIQNRECLL